MMMMMMMMLFFENFLFEFFVKGKKVDETNALYVPTT